MKRGEVYDARLDPVEGSEQRGSRRRGRLDGWSDLVKAPPAGGYLDEFLSTARRNLPKIGATVVRKSTYAIA
jgi:hypothetical protein